MDERVKVILYTLVASAVLWVAVNRFLGTTDEYAATLSIKSTAHLAPASPEDEIVDDRAPIDASVERPASMGGPRAVEAAERTVAADGSDPAPPEHGEEAARPGASAGLGPERADSDADMTERTVTVAGRGEAERALLERLDAELLRARAPTRALDLSLVDCERAPERERRASRVAAADGEAVPAADAGAAARPEITVGVLFRHGSVAIKGRSLNRVDRLVDAFRDCATGLLVVEDHPEGRVDVDGDERLATRRREELKYYLLQRRVPKDLMRFPESS